MLLLGSSPEKFGNLSEDRFIIYPEIVLVEKSDDKFQPAFHDLFRAEATQVLKRPANSHVPALCIVYNMDNAFKRQQRLRYSFRLPQQVQHFPALNILWVVGDILQETCVRTDLSGGHGYSGFTLNYLIPLIFTSQSENLKK